MNEHTHAIIIIKNDKGEFLQYFDNRWNSFLFPNCKLIHNNHSQIILDSLIQKFNLTFNNVNIKYVMDKIHEKHSESSGTIKQYHHYFYILDTPTIPNNIAHNNFVINNTQFAWYSLDRLQSDKRIQEVNSDIVDFIKQIDEQEKSLNFD